jgi:hypothetical protein
MNHFMNIKTAEKSLADKPAPVQQIIRANYSLTSTFKVPVGITLGDKLEFGDEQKPFGWWIRRDVLYYYDADMEVKELSPYYDCMDDCDAFKYPIDTEVDEDEVEDDESIYEEDDNGVMCRYTKEGGWEPVEDCCDECGKKECECD